MEQDGLKSKPHQRELARLGLVVRKVRLTALKPRWLYVAEPLRYGMGLSMNCPDHPDLDNADRVELWFSNPQDGGDHLTISRAPKPERLFDYEGHGFEDLTVWQALPYAEESVAVGHWRGYIARGNVYSCARWG